MGDRCYMEITCRWEDLPVFQAEIGEWFPDEVVDDDPPTVIVHEANYAYVDELKRVADKGIPFVGWHGAGGCYGPERFAAADGKIDYASTNTDGRVVVSVGDDGSLGQPEISAVFRFLRLETKAIEALRKSKEATDVKNV